MVRVRRALDETGHGRSPATPSTRYDKSIHDNIVGFQDDFGLKQDGWLRSGGPTETAMGLALDAKRDGGKDGVEAFREPFAEMNRDGFKYMPDSYSRWERPRGWVDPAGKKMTDAQRDEVIFSKAVGNRIKRIPANDPPPHMNRPNPIAPLAKSVFGERILASAPRPTPPKAQPVSQTESQPTAMTEPKPAPATAQLAQSTPAPQTVKPGSQPASPSKPIMPIPAYRAKVIGPQGGAWQDWSTSVKKLSNVSPAEERAYMEIFAAEGGAVPDRSSSAASGILKGTLDELVAKGYVKGVKPGVTPLQLSVPKRAEVYRGYIDYALKKAGGNAALHRIANPEAAAALADSLFMHGRSGGARLIQNAINDIIPKRVQVDGAIGNKTVEAYKSLAADPTQRRKLLDAIARQRRDSVRNDPDFNGKKTRIDHFRFQKFP